MLSGISRVSWVRVSAWLGSTEDSSGCSRTSSNVSPRAECQGRRWVGPYRPMTAVGRFAKSSLAARPLQHPLCRLDMHPLDHLILEPLGAAVEGLDQRAARARLRPRSARTRGGRRDLVGMDQALAVEAEPPSLRRLREKAVAIVEAVEHAVEHRDARPPAPQGRSTAATPRSARAPHPAAGADRPKVVGAGDQRRRTRAQSPAPQARLPRSRSSPAPACPIVVARRREPDARRSARGTTTKSAFERATASRSSECHSRADAVDPDRDRHRPVAPRPLRPRPLARPSLSSGFTASSRSRTTRSAPALARLGDRPRVGRGQEQHRPYGEQVDASAAFRFRFAPSPSHHAAEQGGRGRDMLTTFMTAVAVLALLFVMMGVKIVRQGYRYTIEHFGRFVRVAEPGFNYRDAVLLPRRPQDQHDGAGGRHPGPGDHHQGQCDGRGRRRGLLPGARRRQGRL